MYPSCHVGWHGKGGLISPVLFNLHVNDLPVPSHHVEFSFYADDMAIIATSQKPALLVSYLESYLSDLEQSLRDCRIAINNSNSNVMLFAKAHSHIPKHQTLQLFWEPNHWVDTAHNLGVTLDTWLTWSPHDDQVRKKAA
jgi:hypothetical protein